MKPFLRRALSRTVRARRVLRGSRIVTSWHDYPAAILGYTESELLRWFGESVGVGETWKW